MFIQTAWLVFSLFIILFSIAILIFEIIAKSKLEDRIRKLDTEINALRAENSAHLIIDDKISEFKKLVNSKGSVTEFKMQFEDAINEISEILSPRKFEIFHLCIKGLSSKEIGEKLFISKGTVDSQIKEICLKLNVSKRNQFNNVIFEKMGLEMERLNLWNGFDQTSSQ